MQKGFTFDANRCTGCEACRLACAIENRLDPWVDWRRIHTFNPRHLPGLPSLHNSIACNHCLEPSCMEHCPALAYAKDPVTGAVTLDEGKCIGCRYCSWACPYDAPQFNPRSGLMEKCTFCPERLARGDEPACVALCPTAALGFGDHDPSRAGSRIPGFTPTGIGPAIRFAPLRSGRPPGLDRPPASSATPARFGPSPADAGAAPRAERKIGLRTEWTLLCFTFVAALLVGSVAAAAVGDGRLPAGLILPAGLAAMALSTLHLGRRSRAWRAILNLRRSWLSREVALFPAFLALAGAAALSGTAAGPAGWAAATVGFAALFAMDRVYGVTRTPGHSAHSAQVLLTGLLFLALFGSWPVWAAAVSSLKLVLYAWRKVRLAREDRPWRPCWSAARILLGLPAWTAWAAAGSSPGRALPLLAVVAAEAIDRAEFYAEIDPPTPARQMDEDLRAAEASALSGR